MKLEIAKQTCATIIDSKNKCSNLVIQRSPIIEGRDLKFNDYKKKIKGLRKQP
jgi:hypothetical protein